ncbi:di-heme cytochrome c peroxidase [Labrys miyagiensis]|uniref:Di-heme cytochrome c peroxidase n=1 Tax=Labrys miyagiensis TaxID=346912 RepID=A0ABQ6CAR8_9HYPH|nr:cytochrome c peroxidase [Labrys miyagiensis]GLS17383.1 di-heme cytochrome c peroxidase [Labrys miyagiensis]
MFNIKPLYDTTIKHWVAGTLALAAVGLASGVVAANDPAGKAADSPVMSRAAVNRQVEALAALGHDIFRDPSLSGSGKVACSSCHDPAHAYGPANALAVQMGGGDLRQPGLRAVPSLTYLQVVPPFTEHFFESEDDADESIDNGPTGGLTWDGRVDRGGDQAMITLLSDFEMGNKDEAVLIGRLRAATYAGKLAELAGPQAQSNPRLLLQTALKAIEVYEQDYKTFYPYSSKYDAYLAGTATLTAQEARGLQLFNDADKGNCASCHVSQRGNDGTPPQFTDYGLIALGVPRNPDIPANKDPNYYDLGLCGPLRTDFRDRPNYCGLFRTPTLRNVALRQTFFHNGVFHSLRQAVAFYVDRETDPGKWYPRNPDGTVDKYNDLPRSAQANLNMDPPFDRHQGDKPALSDSEIDDVVAFLGTLTDGYKPGSADVSSALGSTGAPK